MSTSQNGWLASPDLARRPFSVAGVDFVGGIADNDAVETVLGYVLGRFHREVEPLRNPGCWGFSYRENRNDPTSLSNHSSGTAVDANAPQHPNGVPTARTFTAAQIATVHEILAAVDGAVRWGGDYQVTPDAMHFEINTDPATLHRVAARLQEEHDMTPDQAQTLDTIAATVARLEERGLRQTHRVMSILRDIRGKTQDAKILAQLDDIEKALSEEP